MRVEDEKVLRKVRDYYDHWGNTQNAGPIEFCITPEKNAAWVNSINDNTFWYSENSEFGAPIVHPALFGITFRLAMHQQNKPNAAEPPGGMLIKHKDRYFAPVYVGKKYKMFVRLVEKYIKKGRYYQCNECSLKDENDKEVVRMNYTQIWFGAPEDEKTA